MLPRVSVVVPTRDRPLALARCLDALAGLEYPRDRFEVLVVDDASARPLEALVAAYRARIDVTLVVQAHAGPAAARNAGAARGRGDLLAFTDDDCAPAPGWLRILASYLERAPDRAVGGRTLNALAGDPYATASQLLIDYLYAYYNADPEGPRFLTSNNFAVEVDRFRSIGGFDATWPHAAGEDREFCDRWRQHGYRLTYAADAVVHHAHALTFGGFCRQHFTYGRGAFFFHRARARRGQPRVRVEPRRFYVELLRHPSSRRAARAARLTLLLALAQAANAAGFFWETGVNRRSAGTRGGTPRPVETSGVPHGR